MPQININNTELHCQVLGRGSPIVMIHGLLLGNMATWYFGAAAKLAETHTVLLYDLRGHGLSGMAKDGYDLKTMVSDLEGLIASHGFDDIAIVGHSYGSLIGLHYALRYPDRVRKLVIVEGPVPPSKGLEIEEFRAKSQDEMITSLPEELQRLVGKPTRQTKKLLERLEFLANETDLIANLKLEQDIPDLEYQKLTMPVQLIYGTESQLTDVGDKLERLIPEARLAKLPGGHYLPSEQPALVGQIIGDFFS